MESLFLSSPACFLRYLHIYDQGPPCIYLHGLGSASSADFPGIVASPALSGYQNFLVDLIGFGFSDKPINFDYSLDAHARTVIELMDHLSFPQYRLIGYSMGGSVAITIAALRPELVSHLVLVESNLDPGGGAFSRRITSMSEDEFSDHGHAELLEELLREGQSLPNWAAYAGNFAVSAPRAVYRSSEGLLRGSSPSMRANLFNFAGSRTYVFGEHSLPDEDLVQLANEGINVPVVPGAGHHMAYENPDGFTMVLAQAIR